MAAVVITTTADSRSGILALLKRTGFHLPVFMLADATRLGAPVGVTAVIGGNAQEWLSWKTQPRRQLKRTSAALYGTPTSMSTCGE